MTLLVQVGHAASTHAHVAAVLRALGNLDVHRSVDARNLELGAQRRLRKANRNHALQVVAMALEKVMRTHRQHNVQVALDAARAPGVAFSCVADAGSILNAWRHLHVQTDLLGGARLSAARRAWIADHLAGPAARSACPRNREESLLIAQLSASLALRAHGRSASRSAAAPLARTADFEPADLYFSFGAEEGVLKVDRQIETQIVAAMLPRRPLSAAAHRKHLAEQVAEDVANVHAP